MTSNRTLDVATHPSLPSFAQAFKNSSINSISNTGNALPPIQSQSRPSPPSFTHRTRTVTSPPIHDDARRVSQPRNSRKRTFRESSDSTQEDAAAPKSSPNVSVKEEPDREDLGQQSSPSAQPMSYQSSWQANEPSLPSNTLKPDAATKRRRVTISGINTDVKRPVSSGANTPISPVVMGFTIMRDDPSAIEQVRSMLNVKQQQKALIEQRRSSNAGLASVASPVIGSSPAVHVVNGPDVPHTTTSRPSPIIGALNSRRMTINQNNTTGRSLSPQPPSVPVTVTSAQQQQHTTQPVSHLQPGSSVTHAPPPLSFAHRRATRLGAKSKPADIVISPQDKQSSAQMQPSIMSAPPAPRTVSHAPGRFSMAIPSLPTAVTSSQSTTRITSSVVPPTPTRLGGPRTSMPSFGRTLPQVGSTGRSPPTASVPISSTLVPPTPSSLQRPSYSSERSAFLSPFEMFYDALSDSKQLKAWLGDQLQKSSTLINSLQKHDSIESLVEALVEKKVVGMREEIYALRKRVEELEGAPRTNQVSGPQFHAGIVSGGKGKAKAMELAITESAESYTFPPVSAGEKARAMKSDHLKRVSSPARVELEEGSSPSGSQTSSPAPLDTGRRLSVSSVRFDPRPLINELPQSHERRESLNQPPKASPRLNRSPVAHALLLRPQIHRQHSQPSNSQVPSGQRKSGMIDRHPEVSEDPNLGDNSGKWNGFTRSSLVSAQIGRDEHRRHETGDVPSFASRRQSNSPKEGL